MLGHFLILFVYIILMLSKNKRRSAIDSERYFLFLEDITMSKLTKEDILKDAVEKC